MNKQTTVSMDSIESHFMSHYSLPRESAGPLAEQFVLTFRESLTALVEAENEGDVGGVKQAAHKIKGALLNCGLPYLAALAGAMEEQAELGELKDILDKCEELKKFLKEVL